MSGGQHAGDADLELETSTAGDAMLSLQEVSGGKVGPISLDVGRGEIVGLIGDIGSGVHDVAYLAADLIPVDSGKVVIPHGLRLSCVPPHRETQGVFPEDTEYFNIAAGVWRRWRSAVGLVKVRVEGTDVVEMSDRLNIVPNDLHAKAHELSGGNQQKLVLGRALMRDPDILVLCEPTRGVDVSTRREIYATIRRIAREGKAVLIVTSDMEDLLGVADRAVALGSDGTLVASRTGKRHRASRHANSLTSRSRGTLMSNETEQWTGDGLESSLGVNDAGDAAVAGTDHAVIAPRRRSNVSELFSSSASLVAFILVLVVYGFWLGDRFVSAPARMLDLAAIDTGSGAVARSRHLPRGPPVRPQRQRQRDAVGVHDDRVVRQIRLPHRGDDRDRALGRGADRPDQRTHHHEDQDERVHRHAGNERHHPGHHRGLLERAGHQPRREAEDRLPKWFSGVGSLSDFQNKVHPIVGWLLVAALIGVCVLSFEQRFTSLRSNVRRGIEGGFAVVMVVLVVWAGLVRQIDATITVLFLLAFAVWTMLKYTGFGRSLYAVGGNPVAATFSGIKTPKVTLIAFVLSGIISSFAGVLIAARQGTAVPGVSDVYLLPAYAGRVPLDGADLAGPHPRVGNRRRRCTARVRVGGPGAGRHPVHVDAGDQRIRARRRSGAEHVHPKEVVVGGRGLLLLHRRECVAG